MPRMYGQRPSPVSSSQLLLGNNQVKKLPYSVGFLSSLDTLEVEQPGGKTSVK